MNRIKRKSRWNKKGVSEIIGNLLILGITVTLFSSIMFFVTSMPAPHENAFADFSSSVRYNNIAPKWAEVNITHKGGQELKDFSTGIYLFINDTPYSLFIRNSTSSMKNDGIWSTGETWSYKKSFLANQDPSKARISVMIVDTEKNSQLYNSNIAGGVSGANSPPIIGARGTTPSPTFANNQFYFYASVMDPDSDLRKHSVYLDATDIGLPASIHMTDSNNDGIFTCGPYTATQAWDGKVVIVNATDAGGRTSTGRITISILPPTGGTINYGPYYNYSHYFINGTYPPDVSGGESGGLAGVGTTFYYIRRMADYTIIRDFTPGQQVLVELYSDTLSNLALENSLIIYHPITGNPISPQTKTVDAFQYGGIYGTFYRYVYNFSAPSEAYIYPVQIKAKDNIGSVVNIMDTISVLGGSFPKLMTYKNVTNLLKATINFNHTDTLYLKIATKDVDNSVSNVYVSDIEVSDYTGRYIIKKVPPTFSNPPLAYSAPLSCLHKTTNTPTVMLNPSAGGTYTIRINLRDAFQGWWLPRTNSYTIKIQLFSDTGTPGTGEVYNMMSCQVNVTAPLSTTDILASVGSGSFTWSSSGAVWDNNAIKWYAGGKQWDETTIDANPNDGPIGMTMADIDGDSDKDVVVGFQDSIRSNIVWYENFQPDGKSWSSARELCRPFDALAGTQSDNDALTDNGNEDISVYKTSGSDRFYGDEGDISTNELVGALAIGDFDGDGDGDAVASFLHVVVYTNAGSRGSADYSNSWGMYFNRGIYVLWNDGSWTKKVLYSTNNWVADNTANDNSNPAAMDLAVGDLNQDGYDDIVAVYETGQTKVWLNRWSVTPGSVNYREDQAFGTANSLKTVPDVLGVLPWAHTQYIARVRVADINTDGFPDIIRTSTNDKSVNIFYTQKSVSDLSYDNATAEWVFPGAGASRIGGLANLQSSDNSYEQLIEVYLNGDPTEAYPKIRSGDDTTGGSVISLQANDSVYYQVANGKRMNVTYFDVNDAWNGFFATKVKLAVEYTVDAGYVATNNIMYSLDGKTWLSTGIQPRATDPPNKYAEFTLPANVDTYSEVENLKIRFDNADATKGINFDFVKVNVTFAETRQMSWVWQIPNKDREYHNLTIEARHGPTWEGFRLAYSVDNVTWFNLTDITSTTDKVLTYELTYTPNPFYYVRVTDNNRATNDTGNDTLYVDRLLIKQWAIAVSWDNAHKYSATGLIGAGEYVTGIAVGDVVRRAAEYLPDGLPDVVFCTSKVGATDNSHTLFIMTQETSSSFVTWPVLTSDLMVRCPDNGVYDAKDVELGDTDGDADLDIVLVVGAAYGRDPGTGPTLWHYQNDQRLTGGNQWQFTEEYINVLATKGESAINVETGNIDLAILLPFLGVLGIIVAEALVDRRRKR